MSVSDTSRATWDELAEGADHLARVAMRLEAAGAGAVGAQPWHMRQALIKLSTTGAALTRVLDVLTSHYDPEDAHAPNPVHVALEQTAAAAHDLSAGAEVAARAVRGAEAQPPQPRTPPPRSP